MERYRRRGRVLQVGGMRKMLAGLACMLLGTMPLAAMEIETALGPVKIAGRPNRVAVFDIAALDTLDRLGVVPVGIPAKLYVPELAGLARKAKSIGTIFEPDLESLNALAPDLVILGSRSSPRLDAVRRVAPAIDMTTEGGDLLSETRARLLAYGRLFDRENEAEAARREFDAAVEATRLAVRGKGRALIVMASGPKISAFGPGSRFGWVHSGLGLPPAVETMPGAIHGEAISFEFIRRVDPDWLIVLDRGAATGEVGAQARASIDNELVADTKAWRGGRVVYLPPADFYIAAGGVQATMRVLRTLEAAFSSIR